MVRVRNVRVEDWEGLKEFLQDLVNEDPPVALELEPLIHRGEGWLAQFPRGDQGYFLIAEDKGEIVGLCYLVVPVFYKPVCYIGVAVKKRYRRKDLATQMVYDVASWAAEKHLQYIISDIWSWNTKSIRFFERLGFVERERFEDNYKAEQRIKVRLLKKL